MGIGLFVGLQRRVVAPDGMSLPVPDYLSDPATGRVHYIPAAATITVYGATPRYLMAITLPGSTKLKPPTLPGAWFEIPEALRGMPLVFVPRVFGTPVAARTGLGALFCGIGIWAIIPFIVSVILSPDRVAEETFIDPLLVEGTMIGYVLVR